MKLTVSHLKIYHPKRKGSSSNHHFAGENSLLNFGAVNVVFIASEPAVATLTIFLAMVF